MDNKEKILFVPAWWPCDFFKEQMEITNDHYTPYVLYGRCNTIGLRKLLRQGKHDNSITVEEPHVAFANLFWIKYKSHKRILNQQQRLIGYVEERIIKLLDGSLPDLIHIQSISDLSYFVVEWAKLKGIPVILTEHILFVRHNFDSFSRQKESVYDKVDAVLCVSNYVYRNLLTSGFKPRKALVVGNLVDDRFVPDMAQQIQKNGRVLFVATHTADKGINTLIDVARELNNTSIEIDVIGLMGHEIIASTKSFKDILTENRINNLHFLGKMSHQELLCQYPYYSCLLSTSISETFGISVAEAIAYGTKVICTDSGGIRDFVNKDNGLIVNICDGKALAKGIVDTITTGCIISQSESDKLRHQYGYSAFKSTLLAIYSEYANK